MAFVCAPDFHRAHVEEQWIFTVTRGHVSHDRGYIFHISRWFADRAQSVRAGKQTNKQKKERLSLRFLQTRHALILAFKGRQQFLYRLRRSEKQQGPPEEEQRKKKKGIRNGSHSAKREATPETFTKNIWLNFPAQEFRLTAVQPLCVPGYLLACGRSACLLSLSI